MTPAYLIFHLNLAFSSIPAEARPDVIRRCYWPLLELIEQSGIPVGIELTGWTLQQIDQLDPEWTARFRTLLDQQRCELIGSGWSQAIGPLMPFEVNRWNQQLGLEAYQRLTGHTPRLVLVNEMAYSTGMVEVYAEVGYQGIIMDRDNVRLALGLEHAAIDATPTHALGSGKATMPVLWSDSILFQRLQRVVHGDIPVAEYLAYVEKRARQDGMALPIYCNDAEIFDYRPGRFTTESTLHAEGEWLRLQRICLQLQEKPGLTWLSPSQALDRQVAALPPDSRKLSSISHPIPVKKQAKYNINRWAVAGRDNLWLNTRCHALYQAMQRRRDTDPDDWRALCEFWASDLRTHLTEARWVETRERIQTASARLCPETAGQQPLPAEQTVSQPLPEDLRLTPDAEGILWEIHTPHMHLVLNARRGMVIHSLGFRQHGFQPLLGTLPQGYFSSIELGADFYSGGVLIEIPGDHKRYTDLEWVSPEIHYADGRLTLSVSTPIGHGRLRKTITVAHHAQQVELTYVFEEFPRPLGTVRVAVMTLFPEALASPLSLACLNGGKQEEVFVLDQEVQHGRPASNLVSSSAAFGATDGTLRVTDASQRGLLLEWNPAACAAVPMLKHQRSQPHPLTRLSFSLCELDDTARAGGQLLPFSVRLSPL